jgi:hypothetical protein
MRQVLRFDIDPTDPFTHILMDEGRYITPLHVGMFSDDNGWTERASVWVIDRDRTDDDQPTELTLLVLPDAFQLNGEYERFMRKNNYNYDYESYVGTVINGDKTFIRHVFDVTAHTYDN